MSTATETRPWQDAIVEALDAEETVEGEYAVVHLPDGAAPELLGIAGTKEEAVVMAEDYSTKVDGGEVAVNTIESIRAGASNAAAEPAADTVEDAEVVDTPIDEAAPIEGTDPDKGTLFPRIPIVVDDDDPNVLKLSFSGSIELDRDVKDQVELFNKIQAGKVTHMKLVGYCKSGPTNTHRRDSNGDVDAVVAAKSIVITDIIFEA